MCVASERIFTLILVSLKEFFISSAKEILFFCLFDCVIVSEQNISNLDSRLKRVDGKLEYVPSKDASIPELMIGVYHKNE